MLEMEQFKQDLAAVRASIEELGQALDIERLKEQLIEYQEDMASNGFWDDMEHAQKINQKAHGVEARLQHYKSLNSRADDIEAMMELAEEYRGKLIESVAETDDALMEKYFAGEELT